MSVNPRRRVAIVSDFSEEGWLSMDLVADMLAANLPDVGCGEWRPELLRPRMRRALSALPIASLGKASWNADRLLNRFLTYPGYLRKLRRDFALFHITDHTYAHLVHTVASSPTVVTCHDLDAFRCLVAPAVEPRPNWFRALSARILSGLKRADRVVCVSRTVRDELLATGQIDPARIEVVHNGVHPSCRPERDTPLDERMARRARISERNVMILHVGSTIRRKRIDVLLDVFAAIRRERADAVLVRVGGAFTDEQQNQMRRLGIEDSIRQMPYLEREELAALYRRADVLLLTSEGEGFGLPLVEAMACGCPVVASDLPIAREVCGDTADFCRVADVAAWTATIKRLLSEFAASPEVRGEKRRASLQAASTFTWAENARKMAEIYRQVLSEPTSKHVRN